MSEQPQSQEQQDQERPRPPKRIRGAVIRKSRRELENRGLVIP